MTGFFMAIVRRPEQHPLGFFGAIVKAKRHKYLRRIPTGDPKRPWRYVYKYTADTMRGRRSTQVDLLSPWHSFSAGESFSDATGGGHWKVTAVEGDAVTLVHDETGETKRFTESGAAEFIRDLHKDAVKAAREERRQRYGRDAVAAAEVAQDAWQSFLNGSDPNNAARMLRAWQRVIKRAEEAKWDGEDLVRFFEVGDKPKTLKAADKELKKLWAEVDSWGLPIEIPAWGSLHVPDVFRLADPERMKICARVYHLQRLMRQSYNHWDDYTVSRSADWSKLAAQIKGQITKAKVLNVLKGNWSASSIGKDVWLDVVQHGEPETDREREVWKHVNDLIRTRSGFLGEPQHEPDRGEILKTVGEWVSAALAEHAASLGATELCPEALGEPEHKTAMQILTDALMRRPTHSSWRPREISADLRQAALNVLMKQRPKDTLVAVTPETFGLEGFPHQGVILPLAQALESARQLADARRKPLREKHERAWSPVREKIAQHREKLQTALAPAKSAQHTILTIEQEAGRSLDGVPPPENHASWQAAFEARPGDSYLIGKALRDLGVPTSEDSPIWKRTQRVREKVTARAHDSIREAFGIQPDPAAAMSKGVTASTTRIREQWRGSEGQGDRGKDQARPYDLEADPGNLKALFEMISSDVVPEGWRIDVTDEPFRAHADYDGVIRISSRTGRKADRGDLTLWHEFGHQIEHGNPSLGEAARAFLRERARGEKRRKLNDIHGSSMYRENEIAFSDGFESAYMGKWYGEEGSTELISMGVERLMQNPVEFHHRDPDYFALVVAALSGAFGPATKHFEGNAG